MAITTAPDAPIIINGSTVPTTLSALARYLVVMALTFAVGRGWLSAENVEGVAAAIIALATAAYGIYKTNQKQGQLVVAGEAAPNSVARVSP